MILYFELPRIGMPGTSEERASLRGASSTHDQSWYH